MESCRDSVCVSSLAWMPPGLRLVTLLCIRSLARRPGDEDAARVVVGFLFSDVVESGSIVLLQNNGIHVAVVLRRTLLVSFAQEPGGLPIDDESSQRCLLRSILRYFIGAVEAAFSTMLRLPDRLRGRVWPRIVGVIRHACTI